MNTNNERNPYESNPYVTDASDSTAFVKIDFAAIKSIDSVAVGPATFTSTTFGNLYEKYI